MKVKFARPVTFSTIDLAFTGEGIPPIPSDADRLVVSANIVAYIAPSGEAWEVFFGNGTSEKSETYYWPYLRLCPRAWAQEKSRT